MALLKRIISWLINLFKSLFKKKKSNKKVKKIKLDKKDIKVKKDKAGNFIFDEDLPGYMYVDQNEKDMLLYSISILKNFLEEANTKRREKEEKEFIKVLNDKYDIKIKEINNKKELETVIEKLNIEDKKEIINSYTKIEKREEDFKVKIKEIDKVIERIENEDISIIEKNEIEREISNIENDKNITDNLEVKVDYFNKNVYDIIDNIDEEFIKNVVTEYKKVNYVTVSTMIIDKSYERFRKLQEDFKNHRYNKFYYEREINKLKHELKELRNLKNNKQVSEHIEKLRNELFTKSKDKYDLLYNNEIFMNFNKECDLLLDKINARVVDIKKEENKELEKEEIKKREKLEKILKRFQDMELARKIILLTKQQDDDLIKVNEDFFIDNIYRKYNEGIKEEYNFERNKQKTELVILYNEINMVLNKNNKEPVITLDHINFKMDDLLEAVEVKKESLDKIHNKEDNIESIKTSEKINLLMPKENVKVKR